MKNKVLSVILAIILVAAFLYTFFIASIMDLVNTKDVREVSVNGAGELLTVGNSINGIIPTGKDYYYVGVSQSDEAEVIYAIHADKHWLDKNFDINGMANSGNLAIKGLTKRANDFEVEKEIAYRMEQISYSDGQTSFVQALTPGYVLELNYVQDAIMRIVAGVVLLIAGALFMCYRKFDTLPGWGRKLLLVFFIVALFFALWTII